MNGKRERDKRIYSAVALAVLCDGIPIGFRSAAMSSMWNSSILFHQLKLSISRSTFSLSLSLVGRRVQHSTQFDMLVFPAVSFIVV